MKMRLFLALASLLLSLQPMSAKFVTGGFFYDYRTDRDGEVEVAKPSYQTSGYVGDVVIPSSVTFNNKTYTVTRIADEAYLDRTAVTSVAFPATVEEIGTDAFDGCSNLEWASFGGVKVISDRAFYGCGKLSSATLPESLTYIGTGAFSDCNLSMVIIPNSVTTIERGAFVNNTRLSVILIGRGVTTMDDAPFYALQREVDLSLVISQLANPIAVADLVDNYATATLIVPSGTASTYRITEGWSGFDRIIEYLPEPVTNAGDLDGSGRVDGTDVSILLEKVLSGD